MGTGYISEELKKVPASQYDIEKLSHKIDELISVQICKYHSEKIDDLDGRVTWLEKKIWMGIGGLAVLQVCTAVILALIGK